jgi:hypothetical protein
LQSLSSVETTSLKINLASEDMGHRPFALKIGDIDWIAKLALARVRRSPPKKLQLPLTFQCERLFIPARHRSSWALS